MTEQPDAPDSRAGLKYLLAGAGAAVLLLSVVAGVAMWVGAEDAPDPAPVPEAIPAPAPPPPEPAAPEPEPEPAPAPPPAAAPRPRPAPRPAAPTPAAEPAPAPAGPVLRVVSDVPGAMVFINREYIGTTPLESTVKPGTHRLNVSAEGFDGHSEDITVGTDPLEVSVKFKEVRLSESLTVVHKHGIGSCQGRLLADPAGLRYETTDRDDAFTVRFGDLEAFDVDYLKKNLRVKARGGRTYNFTDPKEQADPLFVFHRNVQAARERLARGDAPAAR